MTVDQARLVEQIVREYMVMSDAKLKDNYQEALEELAQIRSISLRYALQDYDRLIQQAAKSLEKEVQLVVEGDDVKLDPEIFRPFLQNLGHVFRNGVDHGIEDPETRYDAGKDEFGTITCQVTHTETGFDLEISDNGGGINIDALRNKAARMGESDTSAWTLADLVFADGVSSRDVATDLSGRGVGMSAVRAEVEKLGGEVTVDTHLKQGTTFVFKVPVNG